MSKNALIMICASPVTQGQKAIQAKTADDMANRWSEVLSSKLGDLNFAWPGSKKPKILLDPTRGQFTDLLDETIFENGSELLFYYFGHSYPVGPSKISPAFKKAAIESLANHDFLWVLEQLFSKPISTVYSILDTCHGGLLAPNLEKFSHKIYCMMSAQNGYAKGDFSNHLLDALESNDIDIESMLHDNEAGGLTFQNLFEYGANKLQAEFDYNLPIATGSKGKDLLRKAEKGIPKSLRTNVNDRTIYKRVFFLLEIISNGATTLGKILDDIKSYDSFVITYASTGPNRKEFMTSKKIREYINFLASLDFIDNHRDPFALTDKGKAAANKLEFNSILVHAIINNLFPENMSLDEITQIIWSLLKKGIPPDAFNVGSYIRTNKGTRIIDPPNFKFAFRVLPYTGVFRKSTEALFPV
jgi:predicted transcriptional regulator